MIAKKEKKKKNAVVHITAAGVAALVGFPLWKMATIGQSGWKTEGAMFYDKMWAAMQPPYKGVAATLFGMTWARAAIFWGSEYYKPKLLANGWSMASATTIPPLLIGTFAQVANMPLVRSTITLQNPACSTRNIVEACREVVKTQGVKGLWHGTSASVGKTVPKYIIAVAVKDYCEQYLYRPKDDDARYHQKMLLRSAKKSVSAGVLGAALTNPFDVVRNEMFKTNLGVITVTKNLWAEMGPKFVLRGIARNVMAVAFPIAMTIFLADAFGEIKWLSELGEKTAPERKMQFSAN